MNEALIIVLQRMTAAVNALGQGATLSERFSRYCLLTGARANSVRPPVHRRPVPGNRRRGPTARAISQRTSANRLRHSGFVGLIFVAGRQSRRTPKHPQSCGVTRTFAGSVDLTAAVGFGGRKGRAFVDQFHARRTLSSLTPPSPGIGRSRAPTQPQLAPPPARPPERLPQQTRLFPTAGSAFFLGRRTPDSSNASAKVNRNRRPSLTRRATMADASATTDAVGPCRFVGYS